MIRYFLIFLIAIFLNAAGLDTKFQNFDKNFANSSLSVKKRMHKEMKDIYLKTSLNKNTSAKKDALARLVHSSKNLGYNYKGYENELNSLGGNYNNYLNLLEKSRPKVTQKDILENIPQPRKDEKKTSKQKIPKNETELKDNKSEVKSETKQDIKENSKDEPVEVVEEIEVASQPKNDNNIEEKHSSNDKELMLLEVKKIDNGISLKFNRDVEAKEIKTFVLKGDSYRNVVDFKAINYAKTSKIEGHAVDEIRIAQFDKSTSRVVFTQKNKFKIYHTQDENLIYITAGSAPKKGQTVSSASKKSKSQKPKIIVIDAGHGGKDPGAMANKIKEKEIALKIAKNLGKELEAKGFKILYTRTTDKYIKLRDRTAFANKKNADLFVSIHMNAGPNSKNGKELSGVETFFLSPARSERSKNAAALENKGDLDEMNFFSKQTYLNFLNREKIIASNKLAIDIQKHMLNRVQKKYSMKDGGVREAPFWVLVGATMPAILIECGYVTNSNDAKMLVKKQYQKDIAKGIAEGIDIYFSKNR